MKMRLSEIMPWVSDSRIYGEAVFHGISTDSRNLEKENLFVALRGENFDAHQFLDEAVAKGAAAVVVEHLPANFALPALLVKDCRLALAEIAANWRKGFSLPVIGVTGSNGKTTVKEMISSIFKTAFGEDRFLSTEGNLNNEIGVPQTIFKLNDQQKAAVVELGMNHQGEIAYLTAIAKPTVGLVNNAQREHQEFMMNVQTVAEENGEVIRTLPENGIAVFPAEDAFSSLWEQYAKQQGERKIVTFGFGEKASVKGQYDQATRQLSIHLDQKTVSLHLSVMGTHNAHNALAAAACCYAIGIEPELIAKGLEAFHPVKGRLQGKIAFNGAKLIDDTYNANPDSVLAAIDVLALANSPRILVLGDMGEVGAQAVRFHEEIGAYAKEKGIEYFLTLGELMKYAAQAYGVKAQHFENIKALVEALKKVIQPSSTVLVKGSRFMKMERVVNDLVERG